MESVTHLGHVEADGSIKPKFVAPENVGPSTTHLPPQQLDAPPARIVEFPSVGSFILAQVPEWPRLPGFPVELAELALAPRPPLHVASAHIARKSDGSTHFYSVQCSCTWEGCQLLADTGTEDEILDRLAQYWVEHVRLSSRIWRRSKKFRLEPSEQGHVNTAGVW